MERRRFLQISVLAPVVLGAEACGILPEKQHPEVVDFVLPEGLLNPIPGELSQGKITEVIPKEILPRLIPNYNDVKDSSHSYNFWFRLSDDDIMDVQVHGTDDDGNEVLRVNFFKANMDAVYWFEYPYVKKDYVEDQVTIKTRGVDATRTEGARLEPNLLELLINGLNRTGSTKQRIDGLYHYHGKK